MRGFRSSIEKFSQNEFYRNILNLFSGIFLARVIPSLFAVALARIYAPESFGTFVLFLTIASIISIVSTGRYESAIILVDDADDKKQLFRLSMRINFYVNILAAVVILIYTSLFALSNNKESLVLLLIPVYSFFFGGVQVIRNLLISNKEFKKLSVLEITRALATGLLQCLFFIYPSSGLFLGATIAQGIIFIYYYSVLPEASYFNPGFIPQEEKRLAKRFINFPKFSAASSAFNFVSSQLPVLMIKPFFGATTLGLYSFPHRYISIPVQLIGTSISSVYVKESQTLLNTPNKLSALTFSLFKKQFLVGIIPFTILGLWGEPIFTFIFGTEWSFSGQLAQLISPWLFMVMISSPLSSIMLVKEKQKASMVFNIILFVFRVLSLLYGGLILQDITYAILLYSLTGFVFFVFLGGYCLRLANVSLSKVVVYTIKICLITLLPLILIKLWL